MLSVFAQVLVFAFADLAKWTLTTILSSEQRLTLTAKNGAWGKPTIINKFLFLTFYEHALATTTPRASQRIRSVIMTAKLS